MVPISRSAEEATQQLVAVDPEVLGDIREYSGDRSCSKCPMPRDGHMVFATGQRRQSLVRTGLSSDDIAHTPESAGKFVA